MTCLPAAGTLVQWKVETQKPFLVPVTVPYPCAASYMSICITRTASYVLTPQKVPGLVSCTPGTRTWYPRPAIVVHHHKKNLDRRTTTVQNAIGEVLRKGRRFKRMVYVHVLVQLQSFRRLRINNIDSSSSLISSYYRSISNHRNVIKIRYMLYIQSQLHQSILLFHGDC